MSDMTHLEHHDLGDSGAHANPRDVVHHHPSHPGEPHGKSGETHRGTEEEDGGSGGGRHVHHHLALAVDPEIREKNLKRLRRIEGQVRGLQRMVEENLYCADIMTQIASVQEALRAVGRELVRNHIKHCAAEAIRSEDPKRAEEMYEELLDMVYRLGR